MRKFDYSKVKNPEYFQENRLPAHSDHAYYRSAEEERRGETGFRESLNGLWKFMYAPNYPSAPKDFQLPEYDCRGWADIRVPAHIQMEGYGVPQYVNVQYPWDGREEIRQGQIPEHFNPVASYVKYFETPERMKGMPLYLSFQGVESALALWCNGSFVGYGADTFTPSEFELTPYLTESGENKLAVQVFQWSAGSWCEDQDFFRFSGIFRDVFLYTRPEVHISDIKVQTQLNDSFDRAELWLDVKATAAGRVRISLNREEGLRRFCGSGCGAEQAVLGGSGCGAEQAVLGETAGELTADLQEQSRFVIPVERPFLWSAEEPNLYRLSVEVTDGEGRLQEIVSQTVGFRRFELRDGLMKLNGKRIVFKGVNRHEFSSRGGRVPNAEELWRDLLTVKQNNINAIRTCHYPNDSRLYGLCDRLGIYLIAECNLESHGSWDAAERGLAPKEEIVPGSRSEWRAMMLDRVNSMYQRDKNHPAVLLWSCGNEAHGGENLYWMSCFLHENDPTRLVQYEGVCHDRSYPDTSDVESQMYTSAERIERWLQKDRSKPFICCEYTHAMGNSCGAMHKYTDLTDREPLYQGGFLWDFIDQSIYKKDRYGQEFQAYGGDFDDRPCDYNFSGNGIVYGGDRTPSPKMQEVKFNYRNIAVTVEEDTIRVANKNLFVSTACFDCVVTLTKEGHLQKERLLSTDVPPESVREYRSPVELPSAAGEYVVTVSFRLKRDTLWARAGHEVAFGQGVFTRGAAIIADRPLMVPKPMEIISGHYNLGVRGLEFEALFSYNAGGLVSYRWGGKELLKTMPLPNFWRAPVDNDCGNGMQARYGQWKLASMYVTNRGVKGKNPVVTRLSDCVQAAYRYLLPMKPESCCEMTYRVYGDGAVAVELALDPVKELGDMPEFGVLFKMDADYRNLEWYGNGPEETYADRQMGAKLGLYRNRVADNMARYLSPQECGNKTEVRYAKVTDDRGRGLLIAGDRMYFSALPYTPHELENAAHANELPNVHYTVIRAALRQMGVGGDDSWGARVHEEYLLPKDKRLKFTFYMKGI